MVRVTTVENGVINDVTVTPLPEVLASDLVLVFLPYLVPLPLIVLMSTSRPLVLIASLTSTRETLSVAHPIVLTTASVPIALMLHVTIDVTFVLDARLISVLPLIATRVPLLATMNLTLIQTPTLMEISRVLRTTLG